MTTPSIPKPALVLGLAGLIPFFAAAGGIWLAPGGWASASVTVMFGYGAVILSFLGGVHWGRALAGDADAGPEWGRLLWSVTPSLIGWALLFLPAAEAALGFAFAFSAAFFVDMRAVENGIFPTWYGRLRKYLTIGVLTAFILVLLAGFVRVPG
jgi:hypothetical protein